MKPMPFPPKGTKKPSPMPTKKCPTCGLPLNKCKC